jgi:hypothetical protein
MSTYQYPPAAPVTVDTGDLATEVTLAALEAKDFATEVTLAALNAKVTAVNTGAVVVSSSALPTGAATEASLATLAAEDFATETTLTSVLASVDSGVTNTGNIDAKLNQGLNDAVDSVSVVIAQDQIVNVNLSTSDVDLATETTLASVDSGIADAASELGNISTTLSNATYINILNPIYVDYSVTNLPGNASAPLQLVAAAALGFPKRHISVWDTSGAPCEIMIGGAGVETRLMVLGPGADGEFRTYINDSTRISIRRLDSASALAVGTLTINFLS